MESKDLKNKPLVEAMFELRWVLEGELDPHYKLLLGRLFDRFQTDYPEHEELPTASVPDAFVPYIVQHRFRPGKDQWPLIQVGPGVLTVNSTADYTWQGFRPRALAAVKKLHEAHPKVAELKIANLALRYIDAVEFDYTNSGAYGFLREKLRVNLALPDDLFADTNVESRPQSFVWQSTFKCGSPNGFVAVRFATGQKEERPAIVWETVVQSARGDVPKMPEGFEGWLDAAHVVTDDWFFKLIKGDLERSFQ